MIGHLIYNHEHILDCQVQQELSKHLYPKTLGEVFLVHAYNGTKKLYHPYLEDKFIFLKNRGHFQGAADLINAGLEYFTAHKIPGLRYVLVTASDTWLIKPEVIKKIITRMAKEKRVLAASSWGRGKPNERPIGFSTDFFIIDIEWNRTHKLFPLNYELFIKKTEDLFALLYALPGLEMAVQFYFQKIFTRLYSDNDTWRQRNQALLRLTEREPVHNAKGARRENWPSLGLYTTPLSTEKRIALKKLKIRIGHYADTFIQNKKTTL